MRRHVLPVMVIALLLAFCYGITLAPGLSWANGGADGGDLSTALARGGVPHPGGYPLYLLLARPFQLIPLGTLAFRTNLFSTLCTILAALMLYALLGRWVRASVALLAALAFGLAPMVWGQAVITEVYGLNSLLLIFFLYTMEEERLPGGDWLRGLTLGLALANHLTALFLTPLLLLGTAPELLLASPWALSKRFAGLLTGLLVYLTLPLRAQANPSVNWGDASTWQGFFWLVSGQLYAGYLFNLAPTEILSRLQTTARLLLEQFTLIGAGLGFYGLFTLANRRWLVTSLWISGTAVTFAALYGSYDSQLYLIPAFIVFSIWLAWGIETLLWALDSRLPRMATVLPWLLLAALLARIPSIIPTVDAAHDTRAEAFGARFVQSAPKNALIFAQKDEEVFALWYFHYALGQRPDVVILAEGFLPFDWYLRALQGVYPQLTLPSVERPAAFDFIVSNPARPVCTVENEGFICR